MGSGEMISNRNLLFAFLVFMIFCMVFPPWVNAFIYQNDSAPAVVSEVTGKSPDTVLKSSVINGEDILPSSIEATSSNAGIALTFDDTSVDAWYSARSIFQKYNAHVTFFVSNFNTLNQNQIDKLKVLQADGHEIAFHGLYHTDAVPYLQTHTVQQYLDYDIIPGINLMKNAGFNPVDFAWPGGSDAPTAYQALEGYFGHMRDTYYGWDDTIYYTHGSNQPLISGIGIDQNYGHTMAEINNSIAKAKTNNKIIIFYNHKPVASNPGEYETSYSQLEKILQYVSDNGMKTYTIKELDSGLPVTASITVLSPDGGQNWVQGSSHTISWTSSGNVGSYVKLEVLKAGVVVQTLSAGTPNDGSFSWTIPAGLSTGTDYRIRITSTTNTAIKDTSNSNFTITSSTSTPKITVTSPNGGETWKRGTTQTIKWDYSGNPGSKVKIVLMKGTADIGTINTSYSIGSGGKGSYSWKMSTTGSIGINCFKIKVQSISQPTIFDMSNNYFTLSL
jgi:peptidoglycan/xylan/chitin deacetylase (PgdA/CDA1 family)